MYKGWFHVQWAALQQKYAESRGLRGDFRGERWVRKVIRLIWDWTMVEWQARCTIRHSDDEQNPNSREQETTRKIQMLFREKAELACEDNGVFTLTETQLQRQSLAFRGDWIERATAWLKATRQKQNIRHQLGRKAIGDFLTLRVSKQKTTSA